ncbi:flagellar hook-associated protein FlgL [Nitrincola tapanii]|uniref:Flagellar hook-associated protein 3 n=1 Tax=Nitrincola tapanii TaxID=1708751 RepID=A0A5A9W975_9GAMM|nr:flagellar hook-associated protein FlgL [Nitrincola tapanii]KAA0876589.1 flagellar hook-associated protein 3 [Nitrincola tapanii]
MRISTQQQFLNSVNNMQRQQTQMAKLQEQISSGKKILKPSDDPVASSQIVKLERELAQFEKFKMNVDVTRRRLELEETILTDIHSVIDRMRELTIQAGNGALSDADRKSIATELRQMADFAAGLMNTKDSQGEYLFSGSKGLTLPYEKLANGRYVYQGDDGQRNIQVAPVLYVPSNDSGQYLFEAVSQATRVTQLEPERGLEPLNLEVSFPDREAEKRFADFTRNLGVLSAEVFLEEAGRYAFRLLDSSGQNVLPANIPLGEAADFPQTLNIEGAQFLLASAPAPAQLGFNTQPEVAGIRAIHLEDAEVAQRFDQLYDAITLTFDAVNLTYSLQDANNQPILLNGLTDFPYAPGQSIQVAGYRFDLGTPQMGDRYTLDPQNSGAPLQPLSAVRSTQVGDALELSDFLAEAALQGVSELELVFDTTELESLPAYFDVIVNFGSETFTQTVSLPFSSPLALNYSNDGTNTLSTGITLDLNLNQLKNGEKLTIQLGNEPHASTLLQVEDVKQNMLDIALDLAELLEKPLTAATKTEFNQFTARALDDFIRAAERNLEARTTIGSRINALDSVDASNQDFKLFTERALSSIQDLDYAEAISQFKLTELALQAAQATFARVQNLSLFDYLR